MDNPEVLILPPVSDAPVVKPFSPERVDEVIALAPEFKSLPPGELPNHTRPLVALRRHSLYSRRTSWATMPRREWADARQAARNAPLAPSTTAREH